MLVTGFPANSPLADNYSGFHLCLCLIQILSRYSAVTSLLLDESGKVHSDIRERMESAYIYGVRVNPLYSSLLNSQENFSSIKGPPPSQALICSCGDLCFLLDSQSSSMRCKICEKTIPKKDHTCSEAEAQLYLSEKVKWYQGHQETGLWMFPCSSYDSKAYRQIPPLTHTLLNLLLSLQLHFLQISEVISPDDLAAMLHPPMHRNLRDLFLNEIKEDYRELSSALKGTDVQVWWQSLAFTLRNFMEQQCSGSFTFDGRTDFERTFEQHVARSICSPANSVQQEKRRLLELSAFISIIETQNTSEYPDISLFRLTAKPTLDDLRRKFELSGMQQRYQLVGLFLEMSEEWKRLPALLPLVQLSNYLLGKVNHRNRRNEVRKTPLSELMKTDSQLRLLFESYEKVWNAHLRIPLGSLPPLEIKSSLSLAYFLPDRFKEGDGLYLIAALQTLVDYQNKALNALLHFLKNKTQLEASYLLDLTEHPVQSILPEQVLTTPIMWTSCYVINHEYSKGSDWEFNFENL